MKNQTKLIYPWHVNGYVKLSDSSKEKVVSLLLERHRFKEQAASSLGVPTYWFSNFTRNEKTHSTNLLKIFHLTQDYSIIKEISQFNDDKGSSSFSFKGSFPIEYTPLWHFLFCLSIGDGHIKKGKKQFYWYQKPEGLRKLAQLINSIGFEYHPQIRTCKEGICLPQLIRKVGAYATGLDARDLRSKIVQVSSSLGKPFAIALLMAFFLDEAGMSKPRRSEITLHQEGNLDFLAGMERLLNDLGISASRNKKGSEWTIRLRIEGVVKLGKLFGYLESKYGVNLLHRRETFNKKVEIAKTNLTGK